jgi:mRNA export factor
VRFVNISAASGAPIAVTGSWDNTIRYWDLRVPTAAITINCGERVYGMDTNDGGERTLVAATADKKLHVIDLRKPDSGAWDVKEARESPLNYQTKAVAVSRDGTRYAVGSIEGRASVQSVVEGDTRYFTPQLLPNSKPTCQTPN